MLKGCRALESSASQNFGLALGVEYILQNVGDVSVKNISIGFGFLDVSFLSLLLLNIGRLRDEYVLNSMHQFLRHVLEMQLLAFRPN